ncbi:MAG: hypothetical protein ACO1N0_13435 [Fluviicola sp.]
MSFDFVQQITWYFEQQIITRPEQWYKINGVSHFNDSETNENLENMR